MPIPKGNLYKRALTVDDFRGISISPVVSKVFEHAVLNRLINKALNSSLQTRLEGRHYWMFLRVVFVMTSLKLCLLRNGQSIMNYLLVQMTFSLLSW